MTSVTIEVGPGPVEARRFAALLAETLVERFPGSGPVRYDGDAHAPVRASVPILGPMPPALAGWLGVHLLVADLRGRGARRRWLAQVSWSASVCSGPLRLKDVDVAFVRAQGPGGQNVNKRSTAVRVLHRPSGCVAFSQCHRTQARNRAAALQSLRDQLEQRQGVRVAEQRKQRWHAARGLRSVEPVMRWRLGPRERLVGGPDAS